jgi:integrase
MATVNFRIRSYVNKNVPIKVYLSLGRDNLIESNTGFSINPKDWNIKQTNKKEHSNKELVADKKSKKKPTRKKGFPIQNNTENKIIYNNLKKLESFIFENLNNDLGAGILIDTNWMENTIKTCFNRVEKTDNTLFINHIQYIIDNASTRKFKQGGVVKIGLSDATIKNYKTFRNLIFKYEKYQKKQIRFLDITETFIEKFSNWLFNVQDYGDNYAGKICETIKTVCNDAEKIGITTTKISREIQSFRKADEDKYIQILSFSELDIIKKLDFTDVEKLNVFKKENPQLTKNIALTTKTLEDGRNWMLIGCAIGQRGNDLLSITKNDFRHKNGGIYIDVIQEKTKKSVTIGINDSRIITILNDNFPAHINDIRLNSLSKIICKMAGITQVVEGEKLNIIKNRKKFGNFPKFELISSHCFRRSFASNYYKLIPTPILMNITGHSKESLFLIYINKREDKDANADLFMKYIKEINNKKLNENKSI